jgi:hypothetical protein
MPVERSGFPARRAHYSRSHRRLCVSIGEVSLPSGNVMRVLMRESAHPKGADRAEGPTSTAW